VLAEMTAMASENDGSFDAEADGGPKVQGFFRQWHTKAMRRLSFFAKPFGTAGQSENTGKDDLDSDEEADTQGSKVQSRDSEPKLVVKKTFLELVLPKGECELDLSAMELSLPKVASRRRAMTDSAIAYGSDPENSPRDEEEYCHSETDHCHKASPRGSFVDPEPAMASQASTRRGTGSSFAHSASITSSAFGTVRADESDDEKNVNRAFFELSGLDTTEASFASTCDGFEAFTPFTSASLDGPPTSTPQLQPQRPPGFSHSRCASWPTPQPLPGPVCVRPQAPHMQAPLQSLLQPQLQPQMQFQPQMQAQVQSPSNQSLVWLPVVQMPSPQQPSSPILRPGSPPMATYPSWGAVSPQQGSNCSVRPQTEEEQHRLRAVELDMQAAALKVAALQLQAAAQYARREAHSNLPTQTSAQPPSVPVAGGIWPSPGSSLTSTPHGSWPSDVEPVKGQAKGRGKDTRRGDSSSAQRPADKHASLCSITPASSSRVPSPEAVQSVSGNVASQTTVMLRHLPSGYTRAMLLELLDSHGFKGSYDFVYLPVDFVKWVGFGYAFVNMVSNEEALRVWRHFDGFSAFPGHVDADGAGPRACDVSWGDPLQGLSAHIERYRNSPVMHKDVPEHFKPITFAKGLKVKFPSPTKRIRPPRLKHGNVAEPAAVAAARTEPEAEPAGRLPTKSL